MSESSLSHPDPLDQISRARMAELIDSGRLPVIASGKGRRKISITALKAILAGDIPATAA